VRWRKVLGSFQLTIPVRTKEVMLAPEERLLGVLLYIRESIPPADRWAPVFERYLGVVGDRVLALGGDPGRIKPSPSGGNEPGPAPGGEHRHAFVGRVSELRYDRFGEFVGFLLDTEDGERRFTVHEPDLSRLIHDVWEHRVLVRVAVAGGEPHRPRWIELLRPR
jgi:hypothetical protein